MNNLIRAYLMLFCSWSTVVKSSMRRLGTRKSLGDGISSSPLHHVTCHGRDVLGERIRDVNVLDILH